jgi:hypothetical protein
VAVAALAAAGLAAGLAAGSAATRTAGTGASGGTVQPASTWDDAFVVRDAAPVAHLLRGISCVSVKSCVATGANLNGQSTPLAETWNGTAWKLTAPKLPKGAAGGQLYGVSCLSARDCVSAGYYLGGSVNHPLAETWNGSGWTTAAPPGAAGQNTALTGISCVTGKDCLAVGSYTVKSVDGPVAEPLADLWNGKTWAATKVALPPQKPETFFNSLVGVSCPAAGFCVTVGGVSTVSSTGLLIDAWNGKAWSVMKPAALPKGISAVSMEGVSCLSARSCVAVGLGSTAAGLVSFGQSWNGKTWTYTKMTWPKGTKNPEIWGVACRSASYCAAVGDTGQNLNVEGRTGRAAVTVWNGRTWTAQSVPSVAREHSILDGVTCQRAFCAAAGQQGPNQSTNGTGLTAFSTGSGWKLVRAK